MFSNRVCTRSGDQRTSESPAALVQDFIVSFHWILAIDLDHVLRTSAHRNDKISLRFKLDVVTRLGLRHFPLDRSNGIITPRNIHEEIQRVWSMAFQTSDNLR